MKTFDNDLPKPRGRVVGRFRSHRIGWIDPETGDRLEGQVDAPESYLEELEELGFESAEDPSVNRLSFPKPYPGGDGASPGTLPDGRPGQTPRLRAPGRGTFRVRISPGKRLSED